MTNSIRNYLTRPPVKDSTGDVTTAFHSWQKPEQLNHAQVFKITTKSQNFVKAILEKASKQQNQIIIDYIVCDLILAVINNMKGKLCVVQFGVSCLCALVRNCKSVSSLSF